MKRFLWIITFGLIFMPTKAQLTADTRTVLDKTAAIFTQKSGVKASFKADNFNEGELQGSVSGTMCIQGNKFQMTTPDMITWYNGETQWSYIKANEEVNVSAPTAEEQQSMNPYTFVNLYKKGYNYQMKETTLRGKSCYEVILTAKDKKQTPYAVILNIAKNDYTPMCIRMQYHEKEKWSRISIQQFQAGVSFTNADFEFNAKNYPKEEVIDLR